MLRLRAPHRMVLMAAVLVAAAGVPRAQTGAALADAAEKADWAKVRALLTPSVNVTASQADGMTALHWAVYHDNPEIAALLVAAHANVSAINRYGVTPLS